MINWNWKKLPEDQYNRSIEAFNNVNYTDMILIHNEYGLSSYNYCCSGDGQKVWSHFNKAIKQGWIYARPE